MKYSIISEISNLLLTAGTTKLHLKNAFLGKWANAFLKNAFLKSNTDKDKDKNIDTAKGSEVAITNATIILIKGMEIIPLK